MKKLKSKEESLYMVFMKGFILLFLVIVGLAGILYGVNYFLPRRVVVMPKSYDIADYTNILEEEKYDRVPVTQTFGKTGYLEILDENAKVIYDSRGKTKKKYHKESLRYISEIYSDVYYGVQRIGSGYQLKKSGYLIFQYRWNDESEQYLSGTALLDSKRNVIYSNINLGKKQLTKDEIQYLIESDDGEDVSGNIVQKFPFTTVDGKARTALIHTESVGMQLGKIYSKIFMVSLFGFVLAVIVTILLMDLYIVNKVRRPLADLEHAMASSQEGERNPIAGYSGPREVTTVIDTFNQLEEKLSEAEEKQQALQSQKQQMLSGISHDLKTPITVIRGYVDAIRDGLVPPEDQDRYLAIIEDRMDTMANLISSLSDFSTLEHPDFAYTMTSGNLAEYLREYIAGRYRELNLLGYSIEADIPEENIPMMFDHHQLNRVWENIISNSVKYTPKGTTLFVRLMKSADGKNIIIYIGDNGPGIPEQMKSVLMDPFVVAEPSRSNGQGTGLGLSVAQRIVEAHGGAISILNEKETALAVSEFTGGRGTHGLFYRIVLPVKKGGRE